jgi:hypothetical protein
MADITQTEDWMQKRWRPAMGWMYMSVCMFDMVIFPILWSALQAISDGRVETQWQPLTLQGAGLFHIAMGAVLGITAFGRTQEKIAGANNGGIAAPDPSFGSPVPSPTSAPAFGAPSPRPAPTTSFGGNTSQFTTTPTMGSTGKPMPVQPNEPEL